MVVFVYGAQLPLEQRDCAAPMRARCWEVWKSSCPALPGGSDGHPCLWSVPWGGNVSSTARGTHMGALTDVSRSKPVLLSPSGLPVLWTWEKCAKADRFLLPPLLACPAEENNQRWPPQRSDFGTISVVSCCWQHLLEKGFQTGYLRTLLLKTFQFYFYFTFPSCQR